MLQNYLFTAFRNLLKNKLNAGINIFGLTVGFSCLALIGLYIARELSFDRQNLKCDRIYRFGRTFLSEDGTPNLDLATVAPPFTHYLRQDFPEMEKIARLYQQPFTFRKDENPVYEESTFFADPELFDVFTIPVLSGDPHTALDGPFEIMLSEKSAHRLFGSKSPVDQELTTSEKFTFRVTGVYKDFPATSHIRPEALISVATMRDSAIYGEKLLLSNWGDNSAFTYALLAPGVSPEKISVRFPAFLDRNMTGVYKAAPSTRTRLHLTKLSDIHLYSHLDSEAGANGDIRQVRLFALIALVILLIACFNYINLTTAFSLSRAREIGVRKSAGAFRGQIALQFLLESTLLSLIAGVLALGLTLGSLPVLKSSLGVELSVDLVGWPTFAGGIAAMALFVGLLAGLYPAFSLASFQPASVLKGLSKTKTGGIRLRQGLVVAQFALSAMLLVGTAVIFRQLKFMQTAALGFEKEQVVTVDVNPALTGNYEAFRTALLDNPLVKSVGRSSRIPSGRLLDDLGGTAVQLQDSVVPSSATLKYLAVDFDFVPTYGIEMAAGRNFSRDFPTDTTQAFMLNEAAARQIGWKTPADAIGKILRYGGRTDTKVVGILKDFHFENMHERIVPMIMFIPRNPDFFHGISLKINASDVPGALAHLQSVWQKYSPDYPFDYRFLDDRLTQQYESEQRQGSLFTVFSGLAIFIACLGLFGLATFSAQRRIKEIGIRKVLGASVMGVILLLSKEFLQLVLIALVIATPVAYLGMSQWLDDFAYRVDIGWPVFVLAGVIAISIALLTVSFQSIKAALSNPSKSLRSE